MKLLVTGGAGFIGNAFVRHVLATSPRDEIVTLDLLSYAGNRANLDEIIDDPRHRFVQGDIADAALVDELVSDTDAVVNLAAETHVDRSLLDPAVFARTNLVGVMTLLEAVCRHGRRMVQVSTDEVYGEIPPGHLSTEDDPLLPRSPYAAAKAGADLLCRSFFVSYGTEIVITRGCNTIGPRQHPEKMVPLFVTNALYDRPLPVYGDGLQVRDWLGVTDHARAIDTALRRGRPGEVYNVGASAERTNLDVAETILRLLDKPLSLIQHVADRPGHDRRYALNWRKIRDELGWEPAQHFPHLLDDTVTWYRDHPAWWTPIRESRAFAGYFDRQYGWRLASPPGEAAAPAAPR